jgi:uncharacterized protein DUF4058
MPLRDHFRPPISKRYSWEGFHGLWPGTMVQQLAPLLPDSYIAEPRVHLGNFYEIDICTFEDNSEREEVGEFEHRPANGSVATMNWAPPQPSLSVETEFPIEYAYEVLIFDLDRERELVAAVEIVSPANKDRPSSRQLFVAKCLNLLQKGICVSIVDLVTIRRFNLYVELLNAKGRRDPKFADESESTYAATCRTVLTGDKTRLDTWSYPLVLGQPLPKLPIWLTPDLPIALDLEASYESACQTFKIK